MKMDPPLFSFFQGHHHPSLTPIQDHPSSSSSSSLSFHHDFFTSTTSPFTSTSSLSGPPPSSFGSSWSSSSSFNESQEVRGSNSPSLFSSLLQSMDDPLDHGPTLRILGSPSPVPEKVSKKRRGEGEGTNKRNKRK
ncbi:hypothetical protein HMI56_002766 [Coelomomyces lativittatus]|nr:hypothetical protein HMI56_002766 [Coelomomyces lativittatus]